MEGIEQSHGLDEDNGEDDHDGDNADKHDDDDGDCYDADDDIVEFDVDDDADEPFAEHNEAEGVANEAKNSHH